MKCKRSQSGVIKMSVVVTEFMALVLILGVFWKYLVSYLVHTVALIQLRKRLSEKWVGSPRIRLSHPPPASDTHIYSHTHNLMLIWFEKISGNINFSSCKSDYSCLTALCWNSWNIHFASTYRAKLQVCHLAIWGVLSRHIICRSQVCKMRKEIKLS